MTLLFWIVRLVIIILVVRMVIRLFSGRAPAGGARRRQAATPQERLGGKLVRDPQCGTYVAEDRAIASGRAPDTIYFCSTDCRDAWKVARRA